MYSYYDALHDVLTERKKELIVLEEDVRKAKQKNLLNHVKINLWDYLSDYTGMDLPIELKEEFSNITEQWVDKNEELQSIYSKKIEIYKHQIKWLEEQISFLDEQASISDYFPTIDTISADILIPESEEIQNTKKATK